MKELLNKALKNLESIKDDPVRGQFYYYAKESLEKLEQN